MLKKRYKTELLVTLLCHMTEHILRVFYFPLLRLILKPLSYAARGSLQTLELRLGQCVLPQKDSKRQSILTQTVGGAWGCLEEPLPPSVFSPACDDQIASICK